MESFKGLEVVIWGVDNKMQSICICFVQSEFFSKLFHNLSLNFGGVRLQCCPEGGRCGVRATTRSHMYELDGEGR